MTEVATPTVPQARKSVLTVVAAFALIAAWQWHRGRIEATSIFAVVASMLLVSTAVPVAVLWVHKYWMRLAAGLGYVNSRIILSVFYYLVLTPVGTVLRAVGQDPLERRRGRETSYWRKRKITRQSHEGYERSF